MFNQAGRLPALLQERVLPARCLARAAISLPLCERQSVCTAELASLLQWREWAAAQSRKTRDALAEDGGPSAQELLKELDWLLDDAVGACCGPGTQRCRAWRDVKRCAAGPAAGCSTTLRLQLQDLGELWRRRLEGRTPLQYLCNVAHWRDSTLAVGPGVLIPRPETELLIDFAQEALQRHPELRGGAWADLGTGSGALAVGLASILPAGSPVLAVECSAEARAWAQLNIQRLGCTAAVEIFEGHWYAPLQRWQGRLCGVLSNPPYISTEQLPSLQAEVKLHEPSLALDGGSEDGLDCLVKVCDGAVSMLRPGGFMAVETAGGVQADKLAARVEALHEQGSPAFEQVAVREDLFGVRRFVTAYRRRYISQPSAARLST